MKKISQAAARQFRKDRDEALKLLAKLKSSYSHDYPGVHPQAMTPNDVTMAKVNTARRLGYSVVAVPNGNNLELYAVSK
jgi:hypothetical protein